MSVDNLVEWLREQIAEDEQQHRLWLGGARKSGKATARARLAQCEAHRRIVDMWADWGKVAEHSHNPARQEQADVYQREFAPILRLLALAYRHRPGYLQEWAP